MSDNMRLADEKRIVKENETNHFNKKEKNKTSENNSSDNKEKIKSSERSLDVFAQTIQKKKLNLLSILSKEESENTPDCIQDPMTKTEFISNKKGLRHSSSWVESNKRNIPKMNTKKSLKKMTLIDENLNYRTLTSDFDKRKLMKKKGRRNESENNNHKKSFRASANKKVNIQRSNTIKKYDFLFSDISSEKPIVTESNTPDLVKKFNIENVSTNVKPDRAIQSSIYSNIFI
jgi:hypothetical protein